MKVSRVILVLAVVAIAGCTKVHARKVHLPEIPPAPAFSGRSPGLLAPVKATFQIPVVPEGSLFKLIKVNDRFELQGDLAQAYQNAFLAKLQERGLALAPLAPSGTAAWDTKQATEGQYILQATIEQIDVQNVVRNDGLNEYPRELKFNMVTQYRLYAPGDPTPFVSFQTGPYFWTTTRRDLAGTIRLALLGTADYAARCLEGKDYSATQGPNCHQVTTAIAEHQKKAIVKLDAKLQPLEAAGDHAGVLLVLADAYRGRSSQAQSDLLFERIVATLKKLPARPPLSEEGRRAAVQAQSALTEKRYPDAIQHFGEAVGHCPWWADGFYNAALLLGEQARYAEAIDHMKRFVSLAPETPDARRAQDKIYEWEGKLKK